MTRKALFSLRWACVLVGVISMPAAAQDFGGISSMDLQGVSYHVFAKAGEVTIQVLVMGDVGSPGIYVLGASTTFEQLLALSGGSSSASGANTSTRTTVRLFREAGGQRTLEYEARLERLLAEPGNHPSLQAGDVMKVEQNVRQRQQFTWRDVFFLFNAVTSTVFLIERITN